MPTGNKKIIKGNVYFLGDQQSGKTSIIALLLNLPFISDYIGTIGMDCVYLPLGSSDKNTEEQIAIWDSSGMEARRDFIEKMIKALSKRNPMDIAIITIAANQSHRNKMNQLKYWKSLVNPGAKLIVLETKNDLQGNYLPLPIDSNANGENQVIYFSTSAKDKRNIDAVSKEIIKTIQEKRLADQEKRHAEDTLKLQQNIDASFQPKPSLFSNLCCCLPFFSTPTNHNTKHSPPASISHSLNNIKDLTATQLKSVLLQMREKLKTGALNNIDEPYEVSILGTHYYNYPDSKGIKHRINVPKNVFEAFMTIQMSLKILESEDNLILAKTNLIKIMSNFDNASQSFSLTRSNSTKQFYAQLPGFLNDAIAQSKVVARSDEVNPTAANILPIAIK